MIGLVAFGLCALAAQSPQPATDIGNGNLKQLLAVRRVYVDRLNGGETAAQMRDMIIGALQRAQLFTVTENPDRADAILRGSAEDLVFTETFSSSDGIDARGGISAYNGARTSSRTGGSLSAVFGDRDSLHTTERKHEAMATVRLAAKDGDVIWSTTQESLGGKFRGASADVVEKLTRQLVADLQAARTAGGQGKP